MEMPDLNVDTIYNNLYRLPVPSNDDTVPHTQSECVMVGGKGTTIGVVMEPNVLLVANPPAEMTFDVVNRVDGIVGWRPLSSWQRVKVGSQLAGVCL